MIVHKFGGAAVKDSEGVRNLFEILKDRKEEMVVVVSALGKTTNNLEILTDAIFFEKKEQFNNQLQKIRKYHLDVMEGLFQAEDKIYKEVEWIFDNIRKIASVEHPHYDFLYDQVVSLGEILSTKIISAYVNSRGLTCQWIDIRKHFITDNLFREANLNMDMTSSSVKYNFKYSPSKIILTQGFIGGTDEGYSTTLGREGSDYSAALLANILEAEKVIVWKDVPGILNADPRYFEETEKLEEISYQEAIELAYYGAKIIHPKTIKPLQNKTIPLYVKSFLDPESSGTLISTTSDYKVDKPVFIVKKNQILISVLPKDFAFVFEERLSKIYHLFAFHRIKVNLIQNSAINFTVSADGNNPRISRLIEDMRKEFKVLYNEGLELVTIRHYNEKAIKEVTTNRTVLVEQRSRHTAQFVMEE
jgi:aspartate kinase